MIYNINISEITTSFSSLFLSLKSNNNFIYINKNIYINSDTQKSSLIKQLNSLITESEQIMVIEINKNNLYQHPENVQSWIKDILIKEEKERFDKEQQELLMNYNKFIDDFEVELEKQKMGLDIDKEIESKPN